MSLFVLVVAAGHAIPPIIGATAGKTRDAVIIGAIIGGVIAIISGNPLFIVADLLGVGVGTWLGFSIVGEYAQSKRKDETVLDAINNGVEALNEVSEAGLAHAKVINAKSQKNLKMHRVAALLEQAEKNKQKQIPL